MSQKYMLKTRSGSSYEVIDESHLFAPDTWIIMVNGKRNVILYLGKIHQKIPGPMMVVKGKQAEIKVKPLEGKVEDAITKGTCVGQAIFYVDEQLIAPYMKKRNIPPNIWNDVISKKVGSTSDVVEVFTKTH